MERILRCAGKGGYGSQFHVISLLNKHAGKSSVLGVQS